MNKELEPLYDWLCANRLSLNVTKRELLLFRKNLNERKTFKFTLRLNNEIVHESLYVKYSSILIDNKLNWKSHINELMKTLNRAIGLLNKTRDLVTNSTLKNIYHSLFTDVLSLDVFYGVVLLMSIFIIFVNYKNGL